MSKGNWFETRRGAYDLRTKTITTSSSVTAYTTRAGGASDNFIEDRVINIVTTSGNSLALTVTNGTYQGQRLLITWITKGGSETVTLTISGEGATFTGEDAYVSLEWIDSTNGWRNLDSDTD